MDSANSQYIFALRSYSISATISSTPLDGDLLAFSYSAAIRNDSPAAHLHMSFSQPDGGGAPSGFTWLQIQRVDALGNGTWSPWNIDVTLHSTPPSYDSTADPGLDDVAAIGGWQNIGSERRLYTFAAIHNGSSRTIYDGIFWGGEAYE